MKPQNVKNWLKDNLKRVLAECEIEEMQGFEDVIRKFKVKAMKIKEKNEEQLKTRYKKG